MSKTLVFGIKKPVPVGAQWRTEGMTSSLRHDWPTPNQLFAMLDAEFHFGVDVCASPENAKCEVYFDPFKEDALSLAWPRTAASWCNPPYGRNLSKWIEKAFLEASAGSTVVLLLPARTDTAWWHDYCMRGEIRFLRGRVEFEAGGRCPFPSAIVIFRGREIGAVRAVAR